MISLGRQVQRGAVYKAIFNEQAWEEASCMHALLSNAAQSSAASVLTFPIVFLYILWKACAWAVHLILCHVLEDVSSTHHNAELLASDRSKLCPAHSQKGDTDTLAAVDCPRLMHKASSSSSDWELGKLQQ